MVTLHTDGGARGNPGPAAIGGVALKDGKPFFTFALSIGETTNNQAEYRALVEGLRRLQAEGVKEVDCFLDSDLVVQQLAGRYRVKNPELKPLFNEVQELVAHFSSIKFTHVRREQNAAADRLVNEALDAA